MDDNCLIGQAKHCFLFKWSIKDRFRCITTSFSILAIKISLNVTNNGPLIVQPPLVWRICYWILKKTFFSMFYQQSSENQFWKIWRQLFTTINFFSNIVDCFLYENIFKQWLDKESIHLTHHLVNVELKTYMDIFCVSLIEYSLLH